MRGVTGIITSQPVLGSCCYTAMRSITLTGKVAEKGFTLVPLKLYLKKGLAKVELGLARGKKLYDKRQSIAQRQAGREIERALKIRRSKG